MGFKETKILGFIKSGPNDGNLFARKILWVYNGVEEDVQTEATNLDKLRDFSNHAHVIKVEQHGWLEGNAP